ncbi:MAG: hypothetical protein C0478_12795 [Planctomyces sp.]|nr:hypothetical protein [Planctomyces sp.]
MGFDAPGVAPAVEPGVNRVQAGDSKKDPLAGGYFLGPPLPLGGLLYALHESAGEIRLVVLENMLTPTFFSHGDLTEAGRREPASSVPAMDAADADEPGGFKLRWLQSLVTAETDLAMGPIRSVAGLSPTEADGLLICPTGSGRVVAVDPLRRQLVWSYAYAATNASLQLDQRAMFLAQMTGRNPATLTDEESSRWIEGLPLVVGHRVLLTPRESHELHCLDLASGKLLWKKPREDWLSVAGVVREQVLLVGRNRVMAVSLQEGQPVWRQSTMITPQVGTPVLAGDVLYVPLENQEIVAIDAVTGRHLARAAIDPACAVGNLVRAGDHLVMQGIDGVTVFQGVGPLEAKSQELLAADDTKPRGLALRGALRLFRGATDAGFEDLKNSARDGGDLRSQQLLISVILDGLQSDFEKYRDAGDRLEQFHLTPRQQGIYLQRLASGLAARDDQEAALGAFLRLWDTQGREEPEATFANGDWTCRLDHLLAAGIETSLAKLDATGRERGQRRIDERIAQDLAAMATLPITTLPIEKRLDRVAQMAVVFGTRSPAITEALKELIKSPLLMDEPVLAEQWLMPMALDEGHPLRGLAIARWIELLARQGKTDWAVKLFPLIPRDEEALRQMAGAEELVALQADARFLRAEADVPYWKGVITDTRRKPVQPGLIRGMAIEPMGGRSLLTDDWNFEMDAGVQNIVAVDALGNLRWQMPTAYLERDGTQMNQMFFGGNMQRHQLFTSGSLQVFSLGGHFTVVDPLSDPTGPRVLWQRKLLPSSASSSASRAIGTQIRRHPNGRLYSQVVDQMGMVSGQLHGVASGIVFYQVGARLFAAELATGEAIWSRQNIPKGAEVSIDSSAVVIYDNFSHDATILKTLSGELIAETTTPGPTERLWQRGSEAISLVRGETGVPGETGLVLAYHDWLHPQASWRETLAPMTSVTVVEPASRRDLDIDHPADSPGNDYPQIATLSSGGRFRVIDRKSRNVVLTAKLDEALSDGILLVRKKADQYLVIASQEVDQSDGLRIQGSDPSAIAIDGMFYGIDAKTGGVNWTVSVPQTAVDLRQLAELPVSVFCARVTQPPRIVDGRMFLKSELRVTVVDHRTGQLVYATIEPQTTGGFVIQQQPDKRRLIVNLLGWMLEIDFAEPAAEPGVPKASEKSPLPTITPAGPVPAAPAPAVPVPAAPVPTPRSSPAKSIP